VRSDPAEQVRLVGERAAIGDAVAGIISAVARSTTIRPGSWRGRRLNRLHQPARQPPLKAKPGRQLARRRRARPRPGAGTCRWRAEA